MTLSILSLSRRAWRILLPIVFVFVLTLVCFRPTFAQTQAGLIYEAQNIVRDSLFWWDDELYFEDVSFTPSILYRYSRTTGSLSQVQHYPLERTFNSKEQENYQAFDNQAFLSPDGEKIVYVSTLQTILGGEAGSPRFYAIGYAPDLEYPRVGFFPLRIFEYLRPKLLRWSDDSSAFVMETPSLYGGLTILFHVKIHGDFASIRETYVGQMDTAENIFDISPDGNRLLIPQYDKQLLMWDDNLPLTDDSIDAMEAAHLIPAGKVSAAAFIPEDQKHILVVNEQGIVRFNLETQESNLISGDVNSTWVEQGLFSPDNHYLAFLSGEGGISFPEVHVIALPNIENSLTGASS
jgi:WD40 repeat protein